MYFTVAYVDVPIFDTIGLKGKPLTSLDDSLWMFAFPQNFPEAYPI